MQNYFVQYEDDGTSAMVLQKEMLKYREKRFDYEHSKNSSADTANQYARKTKNSDLLQVSLLCIKAGLSL